MRLSGMITAVDAHAGGEPGRVIVGGVLDVPGSSIHDKRLYLEAHADGLRKRMLREPRGYPGLCCNLILPPTRPEADAGFVIMEQTDYPPMSGSNTICVTTVLLEPGMVRMREMIKAAAREQLPVSHPLQPGVNGYSVAQLSGPPHGDGADMRNAVVISTGVFDWERPDSWTGVLDRSACGTGTCARMAVL